MFHPKMISNLRGFQVSGDALHNIQFEEMAIDFWTVHNLAGARGEYFSLHPRLVVFFDDAKLSLGVSQDRLVDCSACYVPGGLKLWCNVEMPQSFQHLDLHINDRELEKITNGAFDLRKPILTKASFDLNALCALLAKECCQKSKPVNYVRSLAKTIIYEMFHLANKGANQVDSDPVLSPVIDFTTRNLNQSVDVAQMSQIAGLSRSQFCRKFKAAMGTTPHRWLLELRLEEAKRQLLKNCALSEIANDTGFADQAHFTRSFRTHTGTTPAVWLRRYKSSKAG